MLRSWSGGKFRLGLQKLVGKGKDPSQGSVGGENEAAGAADARFWPYTEAMGWIRSFYRLCLTEYPLFDYQQAAIERFIFEISTVRNSSVLLSPRVIFLTNHRHKISDRWIRIEGFMKCDANVPNRRGDTCFQKSNARDIHHFA